MKKKFALIVLTAVLLLCCAAGLISRRLVSRSELEETVRDAYSLSESEPLEYAGLVGSGSKILAWYIGREDEAVVCYPVSFHALGRKKNIYFFDEAFSPVSGSSTVYQQWNSGVAYLTFPEADNPEKMVPQVGFRADDIPENAAAE